METADDGLGNRLQYCPWCAKGGVPVPDVSSRICEQHWNQLRRQFEVRNLRLAADESAPGLRFGLLNWVGG